MFGQPEVRFDEAVAAAEQAGIDKICVSSVTALLFDVEEGNREVYDLVKRYPKQVIGFASVPNPYFGRRALDELQRAVEVYGFKGIGELETQPADPVDNPLWIAVLEKAVDLKVPILVHGGHVPCVAAARRVPEAVILLAHMGTGWGVHFNEELDTIEAVKDLPNVYLETGGSITAAGMIELAVEKLGAERIVFGTDNPLLDPAVQKAKITGANISEQSKARILGANMANILKIG
jgi:predicted TIM-barrel fold metal-dependent hydrolase